MKIKQFTTVYHSLWGKGYILSIQYRRQNSLIMCHFPVKDKFDFITEKELRSGQGEITLKRRLKSAKSSKDSLEEALSNLFSGMG